MKKNERFEPRMHAEYQLALATLTEQLAAPPLQIAYGWSPALRIEIHSICVYKDDPTSNTGFTCPLPQMAPANHRAYASLHGYDYRLHTSLVFPDREAHYSKYMVVAEAVARSEADWVFYVDCDAFFTSKLRLEDLFAAAVAGRSDVQFMVTEDSGGINTGVFAARGRSQWMLDFIHRVAQNPYTVAWDQSQIFWELVNGDITGVLKAGAGRDFQHIPQVAYIHQSQFNAFVKPASTDWLAYEWQVGDFIRHFAGCPWQEKPCLDMMHETVAHFQRL
mmetsp:Transcript_47278/g.107192  ORF Transcript_47278/g.107192 Transcript_47278/m.107192 type:complete len:277 (-) Transcript_47278:83-913(-)